MALKRKLKGEWPPMPPKGSLTANQVVAANLRLVRERAQMTQTDVAEGLSSMTGRSYSKATISAMERSADGDKKRLFDAQELLEFARFFKVPIVWFFVPVPEHAEERLDIVGEEHGVDMIDFTFGRTEDDRMLRERLTELIDEGNAFFENTPDGQALIAYSRQREAVVDSILAAETPEVERALDGLLAQLLDVQEQLRVARRRPEA